MGSVRHRRVGHSRPGDAPVSGSALGLAVVTHLAEVAEGYHATYRLRGRALRVISEDAAGAEEPDYASTQALVADLRLMHARGGHFEFFRIDAVRVAAAISQWLRKEEGGDLKPNTK